MDVVRLHRASFVVCTIFTDIIEQSGGRGKFSYPTPRISLSVRPSVTEKDRIVLANAYTMRTSSPMHKEVKMMMMIMYDAIIITMIIIIICDNLKARDASASKK